MCFSSQAPRHSEYRCIGAAGHCVDGCEIDDGFTRAVGEPCSRPADEAAGQSVAFCGNRSHVARFSALGKSAARMRLSEIP
jgi:hypothetical protein